MAAVPLVQTDSKSSGAESLYRPGSAILVVVSLAHLAVWWSYRQLKLLEPEERPSQPIEVSLEMIAPAPKPAEPAAQPAPAPTAPPKPVTPPKPKPVAKPKPLTKTLPRPLPVQPERTLGDAAPRSEPAAPPPEASSAAGGEGVPGGRSGSSVPASTPASFNANYLHNPLPEYPAFARKQRWQGRVMLKVHVLPRGLPAEVELQASSGHDILDESALETVRRWRFVPATKGGKAVASWVVVPLEFSLTH
ncbi:energy transducer TonB [Methylococcus capsulatus]|uniref:energy transducer TonB n=1 Tax=Methylococcus capsulatus TaxID=414 RepID=UPI0006884AAC|nr:energy transducer TonB [Methylococcus capsulatus]